MSCKSVFTSPEVYFTGVGVLLSDLSTSFLKVMSQWFIVML